MVNRRKLNSKSSSRKARMKCPGERLHALKRRVHAVIWFYRLTESERNWPSSMAERTRYSARGGTELAARGCSPWSCYDLARRDGITVFPQSEITGPSGKHKSGSQEFSMSGSMTA